MFKAILFDLDGTLLNINMEIFLQYYFAEMMQAAREYGYQDSKKMVDGVTTYDFSSVVWFWLGAAIASVVLTLLIWNAKAKE